MSLFGSLMGDFDEDSLFGHHMRSMRQMNTMMNSMNSVFDPFHGGLGMGGFNPFDGMQQQLGGIGGMGGMHHMQRNSLMPFGFSGMPGMTQMMSSHNMPQGATSYSSSQIVSMTHGADGRPQVYQASSSTKTGPGGVRETQKTVQDSRSGVKKMAIGHHIGERAHVIEREKNVRTGHEEERQDFINLDEEEADEFNREFTQRSRSMMSIAGNNGAGGGGRRQHDMPAIMPSQSAIMAPPSAAAMGQNSSLSEPNVTNGTQKKESSAAPRISRRPPNGSIQPRRPLRASPSAPLVLSSSSSSYITPTISSIHAHPYNVTPRRPSRPLKGGSTVQTHHSQNSPNGHH